MKYRRSPRRRRSAPRSLLVAQIVALIVLLLIILSLRTRVEETSEKFLDVFAPSPEDLVTPEGGEEADAGPDLN